MSPRPASGGLSRRRFLAGGAVVAGGAAATVAGYTAASATSEPTPDDAIGQAVVGPHGRHQAGIETPRQAHARFVGLDLLAGSSRSDLSRWMRVISDDISRLTVGEPALADPQPDLARVPARLTVTVGFGPGLFTVPGLAAQRPTWCRQLPAFAIDALQDRFSAGDVLLQIGGDDPVTVSHAQRVLLKDSAAFARVRWVQAGFQRAAGSLPKGATSRNLMGQVDGTVNPRPGTAEFSEVVWAGEGPGWIHDGTGMVLRRIRMDLDPWNSMGTSQKERVIGRRLDSGAPLTGAKEHDEPDFEAVGPSGLTVIPEFSHMRLAHSDSTDQQFLRRGFNYDDGPTADGSDDLGLLFAAYAADLDRQFVPIQQRLAQHDLLNTWTTPVGSAVFAIPPGFAPGSYIGEALLG